MRKLISNCETRFSKLANKPQSKKSGLSVAREVAIDAFRQKSLASALATAREGGASAFRPHAGPKTVLLLARSFGWLISAFHKAEKLARRELRAVTLGWGRALSI